MVLFLVACDANEEKKPNVVIILLDDSGYADFEPFGQPEYATINVDKLANEGCMFTNFHVPQAICSASRSALLTGCYPGRTKAYGAYAPRAKGLNPEFSTLAQQLKQNGYSTGLFGKWHLGDQPETRPRVRGFDEAAGLMYSNSMWKFHHSHPEIWGTKPLQYWVNDSVKIEDVSPVDQKSLTKWGTNAALKFIEKHQKDPFFVYIPYSMPHVPLFCSDEFNGKSGKGLYADVMLELDYSIGLILAKLKKLDLEQNTVLIFTSDNGPWTSFGNHGGKTPFRAYKATSFDGGLRSSLIVKYPKSIQAGSRSDRFFSSIDLFPTLCSITGSPLPSYEIDGENVWGLLSNEPTFKNPHDYYAFSTNQTFEGVFSVDGRWKLHIPHQYNHLLKEGKDGLSGEFEKRDIELSLFDMENDPFETINVLDTQPEIVNDLLSKAESHKNKFYQ